MVLTNDNAEKQILNLGGPHLFWAILDCGTLGRFLEDGETSRSRVLDLSLIFCICQILKKHNVLDHYGRQPFHTWHINTGLEVAMGQSSRCNTYRTGCTDITFLPPTPIIERLLAIPISDWC